jgi:hypothetical protein
MRKSPESSHHRVAQLKTQWSHWQSASTVRGPTWRRQTAATRLARASIAPQLRASMKASHADMERRCGSISAPRTLVHISARRSSVRRSRAPLRGVRCSRYAESTAWSECVVDPGAGSRDRDRQSLPRSRPPAWRPWLRLPGSRYRRPCRVSVSRLPAGGDRKLPAEPTRRHREELDFARGRVGAAGALRASRHARHDRIRTGNGTPG